MKCAWEQLLQILPEWIRGKVNALGKESLQEIRLRLQQPPQLILSQGNTFLNKRVTQEDISFCIQTASRYSPWASETVAQGYLTAPGGHRIGLCGAVAGGEETGKRLRHVDSICIRVARDFPGIADGLPMEDSLLILGAPGWGKTTLLRDLIRQRSDRQTVAVVDERGELFPQGLPRGKQMDVLTGEGKATAILRLLRTMGPDTIAVDEITAQQDCEALYQAVGCGVRLLATAHADSLQSFRRRPVYEPLAKAGLFETIVILNRDRSFRTERMTP